MMSEADKSRSNGSEENGNQVNGSLAAEWKMTAGEMPRAEHPTPQWERQNWRNLNGLWEFDFDFGGSARERQVFKMGPLSKEILVPFCPESRLSGIGYKDFMAGVCYRKAIALSAKDVENRVILHFGAVDFKSYIYVNEELVKTHIGGYSSFEVDITGHVHEGENVIFVIAEDDVRSREQPAGKQSARYGSWGCRYTRTTGIWQTVWLEFVPKTYIKKAKYYPDIESGTLTVMGEVCGPGQLSLSASYEGKMVGEASVKCSGGSFCAQLKLDEIHLWEPGHGRLYDLVLEYGESLADDQMNCGKNDLVKSYFGLRTTGLEGKKFMLNSKCVFQRFVLDQGFYPDGIYTAKTDAELKRDIQLSMAAGFNGARLHQKVFEQRFLYHCDKAGYMVWGEHGNWGMDYTSPAAAENFMCEWMEVVDRDFNSPAIIGWCPVNETWGYHELDTKHRFVETVYKITKAMDTTRPCIAVSGNYHIQDMEIYDVHDYGMTLEQFRDNYAHINEGIINDQIRRREGDIQKYSGQPVYVSEYGGFSWIENAEEGWGYGDAPKTREELFQRYKDYTDVLLDNPDIMGFCYTQLYDVEQEKNGLYTYERVAKLDMEQVKAVNERRAKIEG